MKLALFATLVAAPVALLGLVTFAAEATGANRFAAKRSLVVIKELGSSQMSADKTLLGHFSLLVDGVIEDSGKTVIRPSQGAQRNVDGQQQTTVSGTDTLTSKQGTLTISFQGISIAVSNVNPAKDALDNESGTWKITSGSGTYKGWKGGGRWADVGTPGGNYVEWDGYVTH